MRPDDGVGLEMLYFAAVIFVIDDLLGSDLEGSAGFGENHLGPDLPLLEPDLREVGAHLIILVLRPALEGVVVAFVTVEAHAQEGLRHVLGHLSGLAEDAEVIDGRILVTAALRREQ
jgi:hypothetical protein